MGLFAQVDARVTALSLAVAMFAAWGVGRQLGRRRPTDGRTTKFDDASLALLGLLLAFTFSMSLGKDQQRRTMVVADTNAIGDFYTCAGLLDDPVRTKLQNIIREYTQLRMDAARHPLSGAAFEGVLAQFQEMHARMTELVAAAVHDGTSAAGPLTNTLNGVINSHAARLAALQDRLPTSIVVLLFLAALISVALVGLEQAGSQAPQLPGAVGFILLVSLAVYATLDLNQPTQGTIVLSNAPIQRLLSSMSK
jgi:hypothetical protein